MRLLFGQGRHPRSAEPEAIARGWGALGRAFSTFDATTLRQVTARAFSEHNTSRGLAWNAPILAEQRAAIRTQVARELFEQRHGRAPVDEAELTRFVAKASRPAQVPVAGFDLTFSPVKSVSALWALAPAEVAAQVEAAHRDAVRATLAMLEREVAFTRVGKGGIRQVHVTGLIAAAFDHRDSRTGDPDLHTHVVVSNKVQSLPEEGGRWLTLDGRMLFKAKVMASEHYNTHLEAGLVERLGVRFSERPSPEGKRAVREIEGVDPALLAAWSSRRQAIETRQDELAATFRADHGRTPTTIESLALAQQANLETRPDKHEPRSEGEQRQTWRAQATSVLARDGRSPEEMVASAVGAGWRRTREPSKDVGIVAGQEVETFQGRIPALRGGGVRPQLLAARVVKVLEGSRATWQVWHVRAETLRQLRTAQVPPARFEEHAREVERWVLQGFSVPVGVPPQLGEPAVLRRPDGQSAHIVHGSQAYTSKAILAAEDELLALGLHRDGRQATEHVVETVLTAQSADAPSLDRSQTAMVRTLASSGCRLQVCLAPAGAGKTAALRVLARAWEASGGTVLGLAPTAVAAEELGRVTGIRADTLAKYLHQTTEGGVVGPGTLVLIDEAGMAGTRDLAAVARQVVDAGGSVRLVGDDQQLSAVAAGGIFRDLAEQGQAHGTTATLTELHRFTDPAEGAATLGVRDGDPAALDHYLDHGRIHAGDTGDVIEAAYAAWAADQREGLSSLLLAATRDTVRELNQRARADRLESTGQPPGREVTLCDGTRASAGDTVITRRNDRSLRAGDGSWVKNGDRWHVLEAHPDGSLLVERHRDGDRKRPHVTLPTAYVTENVQLGYASTIHGAQGATVDTTHTVLTGVETRQGLYVALSRGRQSNHLYLAAPTASLDGVAPEVQDTVVEPRELLTDILARDGRALSARLWSVATRLSCYGRRCWPTRTPYRSWPSSTSDTSAWPRWTTPSSGGSPASPSNRPTRTCGASSRCAGSTAHHRSRWSKRRPGTAAPNRSPRPTTPPPPSPGGSRAPPRRPTGTHPCPGCPTSRRRSGRTRARATTSTGSPSGSTTARTASPTKPGARAPPTGCPGNADSPRTSTASSWATSPSGAPPTTSHPRSRARRGRRPKNPRQPGTSLGSSADWQYRHPSPPRPPQTPPATGSEPANDRQTVNVSMTVPPATSLVRRDDQRVQRKNPEPHGRYIAVPPSTARCVGRPDA